MKRKLGFSQRSGTNFLIRSRTLTSLSTPEKLTLIFHMITLNDRRDYIDDAKMN